MLEDVLRKAFAVAHRRAGLILLDLLWKLIWFVATVAALFIVAAWFGSSLRTIAWQDTGLRAVNAWIAAIVLRELWAANKVEILWLVTAILLLSAFAWLFLEAFFRSRMADQSNTKLFFVSGATKDLVLVSLGIVLVPVFLAGAILDAVVIFLAVGFFVTLLDTLIRTDAVELLGTDLIRVAGLIGILMLFEAMIGASFLVVLTAGILNVARLADAVAMLGAAAVSIVFLNLLHSYLLLVRFSAVGIMRRNVIEV
jgi:hypothetical protein